MHRNALLIIVVIAMASWAACGGSPGSQFTTTPPPGSGQTAPLTLTLRDTPPAGVTIFSFEVTVTQARLQPGNVALVTTPIQIELKRLEIELAFLSTVNVPAGTYNSIDITFTNPEITFLNNTGASIVGCANAAICEIKPPLTATITYSGAPFPITVTANIPMGLLVDVNLNNVIQGDLSLNFSVTGGVTVTQLPPLQGTGQLEEIEDLPGKVTAKDTANNQFTLQLSTTGQSITVRVDNNTEFDDFGDIGCTANNFTCVAVDQFVEVDLRLLAGGVLLAKKVELLDNDLNEELKGVVVKINSSTQFEMVLLEEIIDVPGISVGNLIVVNLLPNTRFRIDDDDLPVFSADFDAASDLLIGQFVEVERRAGPMGSPPAIDTDDIKLKDTRLTARVASVDAAGNRFTLDQLPSLFTVQGITQLEVRVTPGETEFKDIAGLAGLSTGNTVSIRGLLFKGTTAPFLMVKRVRKR